MRFSLPMKLPRWRLGLSTYLGRFNFKRIFVCTVVGIFILEFILVNFVFLYIFATTRKIMSAIQNDSPGSDGVIEKLQAAGLLRKSVIQTMKREGISKLLEMTVDRLYIAKVPSDNDSGRSRAGSGVSNHPDLFVFGVDMSNSGEALYIYKQILKRRKFPFSKLVVDIGANDGLMSSNSFNFIQWGWNAILVEPLQTELDLAKKNTKRYRDLSGRKHQNVTFVRAVIGQKNGIEQLVLSSDAVHMENHIPSENDPSEPVILVPSLTVKRFASLYNIPKYYAVLSVDAEGVGDMILHQWIDLNYRPAYIIFEMLHNKEPLSITVEFLANAGYKYLLLLGWNCIFEFQGIHD